MQCKLLHQGLTDVGQVSLEIFAVDTTVLLVDLLAKFSLTDISNALKVQGSALQALLEKNLEIKFLFALLFLKEFKETRAFCLTS